MFEILSQLYVTTLLAMLAPIFLIMSSRSALSTINLINPKMDRKLNAKLLANNIVMDSLVVVLSTLIYIIVMCIFLVLTKQLLLFLFMGLLLLSSLASVIFMLSKIYLPTSDLEIQIAQIKRVKMTSEQENLFQQAIKKINLFVWVSIPIQFIWFILDINFLQGESIPLSVRLTAFLIGVAILPISSLYISKEIKKIDWEILSMQKGYLDQVDLAKFKAEKKSSATLENIKNVRTEKINEMKQTKEYKEEILESEE